jgi:hypothetical protein
MLFVNISTSIMGWDVPACRIEDRAMYVHAVSRDYDMLLRLDISIA